MTAVEFEFCEEEFSFADGSFLCANLILTLATDIDDFHGAQGATLESVRYATKVRFAPVKAVPGWLSDAMTAWVAESQTKLRNYYEHNIREAA